MVRLSSLSSGTLYFYNVSSCDFAGNCNTSIEYNFATSSSPSISSSGGGGGGSGGGIISDLTTMTKILSKGAKITFKVEGEIHNIEIMNLNATSVTIRISSAPQQATLSIGEERRFEITDDDFYDILIRLNGISNGRASITISNIHEKITASTPGVEVKIPEQLFDISLDLENFLIQDITELVAIATFENFGTIPTSVTLLFTILDNKGEEVHSEEHAIIVETEEIFRRRFADVDLDLPRGKYTFILTTLYHVTIVDEFRQEFEIIKGRGITGKTIDFVKGEGKWWLSGAIIVSAIGGLAWWLIVKVKRKHEKKRERKIKYYEKPIFKKKRSIILIKPKKKITKSGIKKKKISQKT